MLGSLTFYRRILNERVFNPEIISTSPRESSWSLSAVEKTPPKLPPAGHGLAGIMAGCTVSFVAAPVEHIKARLQIQYASDKAKRLYKGPVDCGKKIVC